MRKIEHEQLMHRLTQAKQLWLTAGLTAVTVGTVSVLKPVVVHADTDSTTPSATSNSSQSNSTAATTVASAVAVSASSQLPVTNVTTVSQTSITKSVHHQTAPTQKRRVVQTAIGVDKRQLRQYHRLAMRKVTPVTNTFDALSQQGQAISSGVNSVATNSVATPVATKAVLMPKVNSGVLGSLVTTSNSSERSFNTSLVSQTVTSVNSQSKFGSASGSFSNSSVVTSSINTTVSSNSVIVSSQSSSNTNLSVSGSNQDQMVSSSNATNFSSAVTSGIAQTDLNVDSLTKSQAALVSLANLDQDDLVHDSNAGDSTVVERSYASNWVAVTSGSAIDSVSTMTRPLFTDTDYQSQPQVQLQNDTYYGLNQQTLTMPSDEYHNENSLYSINTNVGQQFYGQIIELTQNAQQHSSFDFAGDTDTIPAQYGSRFLVRDVIVKDGIARFLLNNGRYLTANVNYVKLINGTVTSQS